MWIYVLISIVIVVLAIILSIYVIHYNKFQVAIIKISEAEENISILLDKKLDMIIRINKFIEEKNEEKKIPGVEKLDKKGLNSFDLKKELDKYNKKIIEITDYNKEIIFDDDEVAILDDLNDLNIDLLGAEKYYNDNVVIYNKLIKCFPSNWVAKICKYKIKDFYSNEKEEIFEILKQ